MPTKQTKALSPQRGKRAGTGGVWQHAAAGDGLAMQEETLSSLEVSIPNET